jgi:hypothetical protein
MERISRKLTNVIHVIDNFFQVAVHSMWRRFFSYPTRHHHPCIEYSADNCAPADKFF